MMRSRANNMIILSARFYPIEKRTHTLIFKK